MFIPETDAATNLPIYWCWAFPGALDSQAVWRIVKWAWVQTVGLIAGTPLWADGNNLLDNVRTNRASLSYSANAQLSIDDASWVDVVPSGIPGSSFTVPFTIPDGALVMLSGGPMRRVPAFTGAGNEAVISGSSIQTSAVVTAAAAEWFYLRVPLA